LLFLRDIRFDEEKVAQHLLPTVLRDSEQWKCAQEYLRAAKDRYQRKMFMSRERNDKHRKFQGSVMVVKEADSTDMEYF
jgi:hypothetical protein